MDVNQSLGRSDIYSAMNGGEAPFRAYIKTTLAQVLVKYWDNFTNTPAEAILRGDPRRKEESCIVKIWSEREDAYFKRMNKSHLDARVLVAYELPKETEEPKEKSVEQLTDDELRAILTTKKKQFIGLQHWLNKIESEAVLFTLQNLAEEDGLSKAVSQAITARLSEVQAGPVVEPKEE